MLAANENYDASKGFFVFYKFSWREEKYWKTNPFPRPFSDPYNLCNRLSNAIVYSGQLFIVICFEWT